MNHLFFTTEAQSKIRMFGYLAQALSSVLSQRSMFDSAYGPLTSSDLRLTHMTGSPFATDIIRPILVIRPTCEPTATSAVSFVPSAITQQPLNPAATIARAAS